MLHYREKKFQFQHQMLLVDTDLWCLIIIVGTLDMKKIVLLAVQ